MDAAEALMREYWQWAAEHAQAIARKLPKGAFAIEDLVQTARIATWQAAQRYDPALNDDFGAYAYPMVHGAIFMSVRRRHYKEATQAPLPASSVRLADQLPTPEAALLEVEGAAADRAVAAEMWARVRAMPTAERYALERLYRDGWQAAPIARVLHLRRGLFDFWEVRARAVASLKASYGEPVNVELGELGPCDWLTTQAGERLCVIRSGAKRQAQLRVRAVAGWTGRIQADPEIVVAAWRAGSRCDRQPR